MAGVPFELVAARLDRPYIQLDHNTMVWQDNAGYTVLINLSEDHLLLFCRYRFSSPTGFQRMLVQMEKTEDKRLDERKIATFILNLSRSHEQIAIDALDLDVSGFNREEHSRAEK